MEEEEEMGDGINSGDEMIGMKIDCGNMQNTGDSYRYNQSNILIIIAES